MKKNRIGLLGQLLSIMGGAIVVPVLMMSCSTRFEGPRHIVDIADRQVAGAISLSTPEAEGIDPKIIEGIVERLDRENVNVHSFLLARHGRLVYEMYRPGYDAILGSSAISGSADPYGGKTVFDSSTLHDVRSISKSVTGLLAGIVFSRLSPEGIDVSISRFFPHVENRSAEIGDITLRHLLTMSSGLRWFEWQRGFLDSDEVRLYWEPDPVTYYLERPADEPPGVRFNYSGASTQTIARIIEMVGDSEFLELAEDLLFEPLGITNWQWVLGMNDLPLSFSGLRLLPRDMLKLGQLVLDDGVWNGVRIVPEAWIEQATAPQSETDVDLFSMDGGGTDYGFFWWNGSVLWNGKATRWIAAIGFGGQRICIVPELELVCVFTAGDYGNASIQALETDLIKQLIAGTE